MKMRSWALTLLSLLAILLRRGWSAEQCGWQAGGAVCPGGLCCSQWGFCGTTDPYCGTGCQSQCPTPNPPPPPPPSPPPPSPPPPSPSPPPPPSGSAEQCGWQAGGAVCPGGLCCSQWGFCGTTDPYCGTGCQSQCPTPPPPPPPSPPPPSPPPPPSSAEQCGWQAGGAVCPGGLCCSQWGFCGTTDPYCGAGCQSQCPTPNPPPPPSLPSPPPPPPSPPSPPGEDISSLISSSLFDQMLLHRNNAACPGRGFYTYDAFITAAKSFPDFANTGDTETRKRELAAFFGQTSHETTGGWPTAPDGPFAWGYCFKREVNPGSDYCVPNVQWPCVIGKQYFGRGPIQLSYNYNYGQAGEALGLDLLNNPDLVETDPVISFKTALWFWMTPQAPKPSCHAVITGNWVPTVADQLAGRVPGYGVITNIINGGLECGHGPDARVESRIGFYRRYCSDEIFGVSTGDNLDCNTQWSFGNGLLLDSM